MDSDQRENNYSDILNCYNFPINVDLDRKEINELGRRLPDDIYNRYINFPVEITVEIELYKYVDGFWLNHDGELVVKYCKEMNHPYYYGIKTIKGL